MSIEPCEMKVLSYDSALLIAMAFIAAAGAITWVAEVARKWRARRKVNRKWDSHTREVFEELQRGIGSGGWLDPRRLPDDTQ